MPVSSTYDGVIQAMGKGEMYSSMGPVFHEVSMEGNRIHVECSQAERIALCYK